MLFIADRTIELKKGRKAALCVGVCEKERDGKFGKKGDGKNVRQGHLLKSKIYYSIRITTTTIITITTTTTFP